MRIRALKPGFFKNEQLAELSPWHRLCFGGLWLCADRDGRIQDRPKRLKAEIFPYDDLEMNYLLWDLARAGFIRRYQIGAHPYIDIPSWHQHQHPRQDEGDSMIPAYQAGSDRSSQSLDVTTFPAARPNQLLDTTALPPTVTDQSLSSDERETVPRIGQLDSGTSGSGTSGEAPEQPALRIRAADLVELWNATTTPPIPRCRELTEDRRRKIRTRLDSRPSLAEWRACFEAIEASAFCRGQNDRDWIANFDWIIRNDTNCAKVLERARDSRERPPAALGRQSTRLLSAVSQLPESR